MQLFICYAHRAVAAESEGVDKDTLDVRPPAADLYAAVGHDRLMAADDRYIRRGPAHIDNEIIRFTREAPSGEDACRGAG